MTVTVLVPFAAPLPLGDVITPPDKGSIEGPLTPLRGWFAVRVQRVGCHLVPGKKALALDGSAFRKGTPESWDGIDGLIPVSVAKS